MNRLLPQLVTDGLAQWLAPNVLAALGGVSSDNAPSTPSGLLPRHHRVLRPVARKPLMALDARVTHRRGRGEAPIVFGNRHISAVNGSMMFPERSCELSSMLPTIEPKTDSEILRYGAAQIVERLPNGWTATLMGRPSGQGIDGVIELSSPCGERAMLVMETKRAVEGRDVEGLLRLLNELAMDFPNSARVVIAPYLSPPVRVRLSEAGLSYVDLTGNLRVELGSPGLFLADRGADANPWRGPGRPRANLRGQPAARVVRALVDIDRTWRIRDLIETAGTSTGATYRVVEYLESAGLADRSQSGSIRVEDWPRLLREWSAEYSLDKNSRVTRWIAPRGIPALVDRIAGTAPDHKYTLTGTLAAAEWAEYAPASLATIYAQDSESTARAWGLSATESSANVILAEPQYSVVFDRSWTNKSGVTVAAASQVYADLATGPGRNPSEGEELLKWMLRNESAWRRRE